jgi:hypothetical protein
MDSVGAVLDIQISDAGARILHDFPFEVALEPRQPKCAGACTGVINVQVTVFYDRNGQQSQAQQSGARHRNLHPFQRLRPESSD